MRTTAFVLSLLAAVLIAGCGAEETVEETAGPGAAAPAVDTTPSAGELTASSAPGTPPRSPDPCAGAASSSSPTTAACPWW
jgi:hypothetical protein